MYDWLRKVLSSRGAESRRGEAFSPDLKGNTVFAPEEEAEEPANRAKEKHGSSAGVTRAQRDELNVKYSAWLFDRKSEASVFAAVAEAEILHTLDELLKSSRSSANLVRRMPGVVPQLLQSLRSENFSGAKLAKTMSHDIVLVGEVIRIVNSAYYNLARPVTSIENAILMLGHDGLRQLITGIAFRPIIDMKSGYFTRLLAQRVWDQSERSAVACRMLASAENLDSFEGFLAGLIQYVGLIASLRLMDQMPHDDAELGSVRFYDSLTEMTRALSCSIAREWKFPEPVARAIEEQGIFGASTGMSPLGKILEKGDYLGKLSMLLNAGTAEQDETLVKGLSEHELACLIQLGQVKETD